MSAKKKTAQSKEIRTNQVSEIIIDAGGRVLVRNLSGELLEALGDSIGGGPAMEARYRKLRKC